MHIKFKVIFEDGSELESHDEMYNWVRDHTHALPPITNKQWKEYWLISDEGHQIGVNFHTGIFYIKKKAENEVTPTYVQDDKGEFLINRTEKQNFTTVSEPWKINNGLEYFPVVGRRNFKGDWGELQTHFCGWKIDMGEVDGQKKTTQVTYHINPETGDIVPETS
jgi:hypothetical protein